MANLSLQVDEEILTKIRGLMELSGESANKTVGKLIANGLSNKSEANKIMEERQKWLYKVYDELDALFRRSVEGHLTVAEFMGALTTFQIDFYQRIKDGGKNA